MDQSPFRDWWKYRGRSLVRAARWVPVAVVHVFLGWMTGAGEGLGLAW